MECAALGRSSQCGTAVFLGLTANSQHTAVYTATVFQQEHPPSTTSRRVDEVHMTLEDLDVDELRWRWTKHLREKPVVEHAKHETQPQLIRRRAQVFPSTSDRNTQCLGKHPVHWDTKHIGLEVTKPKRWWSTNSTSSHRPHVHVQLRARVRINDGVRHGLHSCTIELQAV